MIYIYPNIDNALKIVFATHKLEAKTELEATDLPYRCAVDFQHLVINNLNSQKHMGGYAPYGEIYKDWKLRQKVGMQFWKLYSDLVQNIQAFRVEDGWMSGVVPGRYASKSSSMFGEAKGTRKVLIAQYAGWMEFGRSGQPARPLFTPTKEEYRVTGFRKRGRESLNRIKWSWS